MELLITGIAIAVVSIAAFLYFQQKKPKERTEQEEPPSPAEKPSLPKSTETAYNLSAPFPPGIMDEALRSPIEALREQIRTGTEALFSRVEENPADDKPATSRSPGFDDTQEIKNDAENPDTSSLSEVIAADPVLSAKLLRTVNAACFGRAEKEKLIQSIDSIHNFRSVHHRLQGLMNDSATSAVSSLSSVIVDDPVLSTKVLKMVNSAYFGRAQKVNSIGHALILLGMVHLRELLYREGMLAALKTNDPKKDQLIDAFWRHAAITSICASHMSGLFPGLDQGTLFTAGLLHDIGKIILVRMMDEHSEYTAQSTLSDEGRIFGVDHVQAGRLAMEHWGFSDLMISVVENHHAPTSAPLRSLRLEQPATQYLVVLFFADQLAKMIQPEGNCAPVDPVHASYHSIINPDRFTRSATDGVLLTKIVKSEAFAA